MDIDVDVLVVGAGPSGLALALQASALGARVRVVEQRRERGRASRAMILHPRTLEVLRPLGVTDGLLSAASRPLAWVYTGAGRVCVSLDAHGLTGTAFPHPILLPQSTVEAILENALAGRGVRVERGTALVALRQTTDAVNGVVRSGSRAEVIRCRYLAGCDGSDSTVRSLLGIAWPGGRYRQEIVLADLDLSGPVAVGAHIGIRREGLVFLFPLGEGAGWRLMATRVVRPSTTSPLRNAELGELLAALGLPVQIVSVAWSDRVRVQHHVASTFRHGRVLLVGDAAHVHSPAGGQGMNTGLQDAVNLGWKLAFLARGHWDDADAAQELLASYERERRPVARRTLALTQPLFWVEAGAGWVPAWLRGSVAAWSLPLVRHVLRRRQPLSVAVWLLGQFWVDYRHSPLTVDRARRRRADRAGSRLADRDVIVGDVRERRQALVALPGVHLLVARDASDPRVDRWGRDVTVHRVADWLGRGVIVVRPDGYIGYRADVLREAEVTTWLTRVLGTGADPGRTAPRS